VQFCHAAFAGMPFRFLLPNFAEIGQSLDELRPKSAFQDGDRHHLEFYKFQCLVT